MYIYKYMYICIYLTTNKSYEYFLNMNTLLIYYACLLIECIYFSYNLSLSIPTFELTRSAHLYSEHCGDTRKEQRTLPDEMFLGKVALACFHLV